MNNKAEGFCCQDGNCVYYKPLGMHTNAGCNCINATSLKRILNDKGFLEFHAKILKICENVAEMRDHIKRLEDKLSPSDYRGSH